MNTLNTSNTTSASQNTANDWKRGDVLESLARWTDDQHIRVIFFDFMAGRGSFITSDGSEYFIQENSCWNWKKVGHVEYDALPIEEGCLVTLTFSKSRAGLVLAIRDDYAWVHFEKDNTRLTLQLNQLKRIES